MLFVLKHRKFSMKEKKRKRVREKWLEVIERRKRRPKANQIVEKKIQIQENSAVGRSSIITLI